MRRMLKVALLLWAISCHHAIVNGRLTGKKTLCYGHRGYSSKYPENTILSLQSALVLGADGIETDIRLTSDSKIILMHDPTYNTT